MKILITGATGFVGKALALRLAERGHDLVALSRSAARATAEIPAPCKVYDWDARSKPPAEAYAGVEAIVHLAGESVAGGRWTKERKRRILESRVKSAQALLEGAPAPLKAYVSASAVGYYGDRGEEELGESASPGGGFLARVCLEWEAVAQAHKAKFKRAVFLRTGIALGQGGGALTEMLPIFQSGLGGPLGSGRQWLPWIHLEDLVSMYVEAISNEAWQGPINAVAPAQTRFKEFAAQLGEVLHKSAKLPAPAFALKLALGEMSSALLSSQKVLPKRAQELGYKFKFPELRGALQEVLQFEAEGDSTFRAVQWIPQELEKVFEFFSEARNLEKLTPPFLNFRVLQHEPEKICRDCVIDYRLKVHGVPLQWRSRITEWVPPRHFVDDQVKGPYRKWVHLHTFEPFRGGTLVRDLVRYRLPLGMIGRIGGSRLVASDVGKIFAFRREAIARTLS